MAEINGMIRDVGGVEEAKMDEDGATDSNDVMQVGGVEEEMTDEDDAVDSNDRDAKLKDLGRRIRFDIELIRVGRQWYRTRSARRGSLNLLKDLRFVSGVVEHVVVKQQLEFKYDCRLSQRQKKCLRLQVTVTGFLLNV